MTDLSTMIAAKSDQLNADDLLAGPIDIEITNVRGCSEPEQPVAIHYVGDEGKPFKPCKTIRRVLVAAWGAQGKDYVGRRLRLYRDDAVKFGGIQVGGIRISHMSHLQGDMSIPVNITRGKKAAYPVKVLRAPDRGNDFPGDRQRRQGEPSRLTLPERAEAFLQRVLVATTSVKMDSLWAASEGLRTELGAEDADLLGEVTGKFNAKRAALEATDGEEPA